MNKIAKNILNLFLQGVLYITPIFIPLYIIYSIFISLDSNFENWFGIDMPGLGIIALFTVLTIIGWLGKIFITEPIQKLFYRFLEKTPLSKSFTEKDFIGNVAIPNPVSRVKKDILSSLDRSIVREIPAIAISYIP